MRGSGCRGGERDVYLLREAVASMVSFAYRCWASSLGAGRLQEELRSSLAGTPEPLCRL